MKNSILKLKEKKIKRLKNLNFEILFRFILNIKNNFFFFFFLNCQILFKIPINSDSYKN
jgi:hypothetical protein